MKQNVVFALALALMAGLVMAPASAFAEPLPPGQWLRSLTWGMQGPDIEALQTMLAQDTSVYPEGWVTGFFGAMTQKAVREFQKKHGIEQVGVVGPKTKARILSLLSASNASTTGSFVPPGLAKKFLTRSAGTTSSLPAKGVGTETICHVPKGNPGAKHTLVVGIPAVKAHLAHGDTVGACAGDPGPRPDTTAPTISLPAASGVSSTTATVSWTTDELSDSTVWYATSTPVTPALPTLSFGTTTLATSHSIVLSGLASSTIYYYVAQSKDAAGNTATTTSLSFTTLAI